MSYTRRGIPLCIAVLLALATLPGNSTSITAQEEAKSTAVAESTAPAAPAEVKPDEAANPAEATPAADATPSPAPEAQEAKNEKADSAPAVAINETQYAVDNIVLFIAAVLVLFMQAGFALVETGLNAAKNAVNIMFKNYMDLCIGALLFFLVGFGIMYPSMYSADTKTVLVPGWLEFGGAEIPSPIPGQAALPTVDAAHPLHPAAFFLFQVAFCATAATIVSGAVAGRIRFSSYIIYTAVISGLIYPISGMWMWGGGWLYTMGFKDFAGSVVVHTVGGMAGLAGAIALGPRIGKFVNGKPMPMPGHNLPYATLGVFILLIGWYGFNPGSQLAFAGSANTDTVMIVAVNTTLAACTGGIFAMITSWMLYKKPDLTFALNGGLAGLVAITANCNVVSYNSALIIGSVAGVLVCLAVVALDKLKIDDPVGAFPVHGVCGMWGGIATGLFYSPELMNVAMLPGAGPASLTTQIVGTLAIGCWALVASLGLFFGLKACNLLRVAEEEELAGLDISEHGQYAYPPQLVVDAFGGSLGSPSAAATPMASHPKPATEAL